MADGIGNRGSEGGGGAIGGLNEGEEKQEESDVTARDTSEGRRSGRTEKTRYSLSRPTASSPLGTLGCDIFGDSYPGLRILVGIIYLLPSGNLAPATPSNAEILLLLLILLEKERKKSVDWQWINKNIKRGLAE